MTRLTDARKTPSQPRETSLPRLESGDHLDQKTFHERYEAMPEDFRAELIGGIVFVSSPLKRPHGRMHTFVIHWLAEYEMATPDTEVLDNATVILGDESEPQPDAFLRIVREEHGQTHEEDEYITGPPELIVEVASIPQAIDVHRKRADYEREGVQEYAIVILRPAEVRWFGRRDNAFVQVEPGADGIFRSAIFPGLWLDPQALLNHNRTRLLEVLSQGLATPEHAAFVAKLQQG